MRMMVEWRADGKVVLMADPNWNRGYYYDGVPPHNGMKLARRESSFWS